MDQRRNGGWAVVAGLSTLGLGWQLAGHVPPLSQIPASYPARTTDEALVRLHALDAGYGDDILPVCRTKVWHAEAGSGDDTADSVVICLHGYTNCPQQFARLGAELRADGHTVLAPRLPYHGQRDRAPQNLNKMTSVVLAHFLGEVLDLAHGLGKRITLFGLSLGGLLAGWAAQQRADLDHVLMVSPALGLIGVQPWLRRPMTNVLPYWPDKFIWWDPDARAERRGPAHAYLGYSLRGVGTILGLGNGLLHAAAQNPPAAKRITIAVNPTDEVIDNRSVLALASRWQPHACLELYRFAAEENLIHDMIDPEQPNQKVHRVYPIVREQLVGRPA